jgi:hypothetical protein
VAELEPLIARVRIPELKLEACIADAALSTFTHQAQTEGNASAGNGGAAVSDSAGADPRRSSPGRVADDHRQVTEETMAHTKDTEREAKDTEPEETGSDLEAAQELAPITAEHELTDVRVNLVDGLAASQAHKVGALR